MLICLSLLVLLAFLFLKIWIFRYYLCIEFRVGLFRTFRANTVRKSRIRVFLYVGFQVLPVTLVVADIPAPGAHWQQSLKRFNLFKSLCELSYEFLAFNGILDGTNQLASVNLAFDQIILRTALHRT